MNERWPAGYRERARTLREQGVSYAQIGRTLGVPATTVRSWMNTEYREQQRWRRREMAGLCSTPGCNNLTSYNPNQPGMVSRFCRSCAAVRGNSGRRGRGKAIDAVMAALDSCQTPAAIAKQTGHTSNAVSQALEKLMGYGWVERTKHGHYEKVQESGPEAPPEANPEKGGEA